MKLALFTNHAGILPALDYFFNQGWLSSVIATDKLSSNNLQIADYCTSRNIPFLKVSHTQLEARVVQLWKNNQPDMVIMMGFTYRIPSSLFTIPPLGFYNVHFSLLPAYKGPDPIFWQIRNGEQGGGISIHKVTAVFDSGELVMQQKIPFISGENWGICNSRYTHFVHHMLLQLVEIIKQNQIAGSLTVTESDSYYSYPGVADLTINWETHTAQEIENLVNAANPVYGGAITAFQERPLRILEVSPVDGAGLPDTVAGQIVHHDHTGLFVQCADQKILRINVAILDEIILSGFKLGMLGANTGVKLGKANFNYHTVS